MAFDQTREDWIAHRAAQGRATSDDFATMNVLLRYQQDIIEACAREKVVVVEKSRRTGATWGAAADAVLRSGAQRSAGGMDTLYMGTSQDMAREFIDACAMWARAFEQAVQETGDVLFDDGSDKGIMALRIRFASGFEIVALSARPRSLRGRQGFAIIDEAAFVDNLPEIMKAALAFLIWGGRVLIISTHNGDSNPFNQLVVDIRSGRKPYKILRFDIDEALEQGLFERLALKFPEEHGAWTPEGEAAWRQEMRDFYGEGAAEELYCIPAFGAGVFLPRALIEARADRTIRVVRLERPASWSQVAEWHRRSEIEAWCAGELKPLLDGLDRQLPHALGEDFGRVADLTVLWVLATQRTLERHTPFVVELRNIPFEQQRQIAFYIGERLPRFGGAKFDATGNGAYLAEVFAQKFGPDRVEQVKLSEAWYRDNGPPLKAAFEDGLIRIPADLNIVDDLCQPVLKNGTVTIPPVPRGARKRRHADAFVALLMAYAASRSGMVPDYEYTPVSDLDSDGFDFLAEDYGHDNGGRQLW